ncbi:MAG TPA: OmpA family protein [Daejeonella sp.]|nr:OmpA family protein [Daejeonella sp.]
MDFIEMLKNEVSNNSINLISQQTGEGEEKTKAGIFAAIPAVLAGIMKNGTTGGAGFLTNMLTGEVGDRMGGISGSNLTDTNSLLDRGKSMLGSLFGEDTDSVTNAISDSSGLSRQKSSGLLAMAAPIIIGAITQLMKSKGWSISDLLRKLFESKSEIASSLPGNLGSIFGLASLRTPDLSSFDIPGRTTQVPPVNVPPATSRTTVPPARDIVHDEPTGSGMGFLKWLIPLILIALAGWWLFGRNNDNESGVTTADSLDRGADTSFMEGAAGTVTGALNDAGDYIYDLGKSIQKKLPDGTELSIGENSVENRLINFIEDDNRAVDKTTWFSFDRLYFETGKSTLKAESKEQLQNIAAIMKAYPKVKIKLGGYTDSTGDATANKRLSNDRAVSAMKELTKLGVAADRLEAEGYGSEHPIASNETPEGRAQNRRIDIRVTEK